MKFSRHLQDPAEFLAVHSAFRPQGEGSHGELYSITESESKQNSNEHQNIKRIGFKYSTLCLYLKKILKNIYLSRDYMKPLDHQFDRKDTNI